MAIGIPLFNDISYGFVCPAMVPGDGLRCVELESSGNCLVAENDGEEEEKVEVEVEVEKEVEKTEEESESIDSSDEDLEDNENFDEDFDEDFEQSEYDLEEMEDEDVEKLNGRSCGIKLDD